MKKFIVKSENDELTANHIIDTLENEFDIITTVKEVNPIDETKLDELALNIYNLNGETPEALKVPEHPNKEIYDWMCKCFNTMIWGIKLGYRKAKEE